ncbi:MAG: hypothetical protein ACHBN1_12800 [Heteroscytonema crispum UTEX LB 1556]
MAPLPLGAKLTGGNLPDCRRKRPNTHQSTTLRVHQSPGSGKRHCDPWPDPKTAVAPLPLGAPSPTTNNQQ